VQAASDRALTISASKGETTTVTDLLAMHAANSYQPTHHHNLRMQAAENRDFCRTMSRLAEIHRVPPGLLGSLHVACHYGKSDKMMLIWQYHRPEARFLEGGAKSVVKVYAFDRSLGCWHCLLCRQCKAESFAEILLLVLLYTQTGKKHGH